jgi:hypothetical protein
MKDMRNMYGSAITESERNEMMRQMQKNEADRASRDMNERSGAAMTRGEMKVTKRETRKGKR